MNKLANKLTTKLAIETKKDAKWSKIKVDLMGYHQASFNHVTQWKLNEWPQDYIERQQKKSFFWYF